MIDLDDLERLCREATPQDWIAHPPRVYIGLLEGRPAYVDFCNTPNMDANAALIAALRNAAPELIAMARRWQALDTMMQSGPEAHLEVNGAGWPIFVAALDGCDMQEQKP